MSVCQIDAALEQVEMQGRIKNCVHLRSIVAGQVEAGWGSGAAGTNDEAKSLCKEISMGKYCRGPTRATQAEASSQALRVAPGGDVCGELSQISVLAHPSDWWRCL